jgi:hypothetical protein
MHLRAVVYRGHRGSNDDDDEAAIRGCIGVLLIVTTIEAMSP